MNHEKKHVLVLHRWREEYAKYPQYVDHSRNRVTYLTTSVGSDGVPREAAGSMILETIDDLTEVRAAVRTLVARFGEPGAVVALKEEDLDTAAILRADYGCPGPRIEGLLVFRDKDAMCSRIRAAGLSAPAFDRADDRSAVAAFAERHGWPLIIKPTIGSASEGVVRVENAEELAATPLGDRPRIVQEFVEQPIFHVDGYFDGTELRRWYASRYVGNCLDFRAGRVLGSVEDDRTERVAAIGEAATSYLAALTAAPVVFHLELFVAEPEPGQFRCSFLEVGARVGGAEIPFVWREVHDHDLMADAFALQCGRLPEDPGGTRDPAGFRDLAGWLLVGAPAGRPCRITASTSMAGLVPGPYAERVLTVGEVLPAADGFYEHVGGRFRFRGRCSSDVMAAIEKTAAAFHVAAEPLAPVHSP